MEVELQLARKVAELLPLESATEWQVEQTRRRVIKSQLDPLEAVKGLTAEAERLELPGEELSCRFRLQLAAFGRGGCWLACSFAVGGLDNRGSGMWFTRNTACFTARGVRVGLAT